MKPADKHPGPLPRYGVGDDEKTRPGVVLFDWSGDDEPTIHVTPIGRNADTSPTAPLDDELDEFDMKLFRPRWHGVGRRPGAVALAVVLGLSITIGVFAMFGSGEAQAEAADASSLVGP
jgi:hypothetical protein